MKKIYLFAILASVFLTGCATNTKETDESSESSSSRISSSVSSESRKEASTSEELTWSSMDEAITFYEDTIIENKGEELAGIALEGEFYEKDSWELIDNTGDTIVLSLANVGRGGKDTIEFLKEEEYTILTYFIADSPYPEEPTERKTVRNSDKVITEEEDFRTVETINPFTEETAFEYLKTQMDIGDKIAIQTSTYNDEEKYYELILVSPELQAQGGSGTVGMYRVYENKTIQDVSGE